MNRNSSCCELVSQTDDAISKGLCVLLCILSRLFFSSLFLLCKMGLPLWVAIKASLVLVMLSGYGWLLDKIWYVLSQEPVTKRGVGRKYLFLKLLVYSPLLSFSLSRLLGCVCCAYPIQYDSRAFQCLRAFLYCTTLQSFAYLPFLSALHWSLSASQFGDHGNCISLV